MIDVCNVKIVIVVDGDHGEEPVCFARETNVMPTRFTTIKSLKPECLRAFKKTFEIIAKEMANERNTY